MINWSLRLESVKVKKSAWTGEKNDGIFVLLVTERIRRASVWRDACVSDFKASRISSWSRLLRVVPLSFALGQRPADRR